MAQVLLSVATTYSGFRGRAMGVDANGSRDDRFRGVAGEARSGSGLSGISSASGQHSTLQTSDGSASPKILALTVSNTSHDIAASARSRWAIQLELTSPAFSVDASLSLQTPPPPVPAAVRAAFAGVSLPASYALPANIRGPDSRSDSRWRAKTPVRTLFVHNPAVESEIFAAHTDCRC